MAVHDLPVLLDAHRIAPDDKAGQIVHRRLHGPLFALQAGLADARNPGVRLDEHKYPRLAPAKGYNRLDLTDLYGYAPFLLKSDNGTSREV